MIEFNLPIQQNNFYTSTTSYLLKGFQGFMRYFLIIMYFGVMVAVMNESFLNVASWVAKGELPTVSQFGEAIFYTMFSFITLSAPSMLAGLVFSILTSLLKNKKMIILITSMACAWFNYHYLGQMSYFKGGDTYVVSSITLVLATGGAAVFSALLARFACGTLKLIFMPLSNDELEIVTVETEKYAEVESNTAIKYTQVPVAYGFNLQPV